MGFGTFTEILFYVSYFKGMGWVWGSAQASRMPESFNWYQPDNFYHFASSIFVFYFRLERVLLDLCL